MNNKKTEAKQPVESEATPVSEVIKAKKKTMTKTQKSVINCPKCNRAYKKQESLDKHVEGCNGVLGGGMPPGHHTEKTKELKAIKAGMQQAIAGRVNELITHQFKQALGSSKLMVRELVEDGQLKRGKAPKGNEKKHFRVREVVEDAEYMIYMSLEHDEHGHAKDKDTGLEFFYFQGKGGNYLALANLLDRAFGKPKENLELGEDPDAPLPKSGTGETTELAKLFRDFVMDKTKAPEPKNAKGN